MRRVIGEAWWQEQENASILQLHGPNSLHVKKDWWDQIGWIEVVDGGEKKRGLDDDKHFKININFILLCSPLINHHVVAAPNLLQLQQLGVSKKDWLDSISEKSDPRSAQIASPKLKTEIERTRLFPLSQARAKFFSKSLTRSAWPDYSTNELVLWRAQSTSLRPSTLKYHQQRHTLFFFLHLLCWSPHSSTTISSHWCDPILPSLWSC